MIYSTNNCILRHLHMLMHFCIFFISILASLNFIVPLKMQSHFQRNLKRERRNSPYFFLEPKRTTGCWAWWKEKGEHQGDVSGTTRGHSRLYILRALSLHPPQGFVLCLFKGQMNPFLPHEISLDFYTGGRNEVDRTRFFSCIPNWI